MHTCTRSEVKGEPGESSAREEEEGDIFKGEVKCKEELNLSDTSGSVAPQVMIYQAQHDYLKYLKVFLCSQCKVEAACSTTSEQLQASQHLFLMRSAPHALASAKW